MRETAPPMRTNGQFIPLLLAIALPLALCQSTTSDTPAPSTGANTEVGVAIVGMGQDEIAPDPVVYGEYPFLQSDQLNYDVAATLNLSAMVPGAPTSTPSPPAADDGGLAWYYIVMIVIGSVLVAAILALLIWYGINSSKQSKKEAPAVLPAEGSASRLMAGLGGYPPPHRYSKVIQVPLVHHLQPPPGIA